MADIRHGRQMAEIDGDFVVFLIGARFSLLHPIRTFRDLGGRNGMRAMLQHLVEHPDKGLLGYTMGLPVIVQYWRSFDDLERFARDTSDPHAAVWREYYRRHAQHGKGAGIWHETYLVRAGEYEAVYHNMPEFGLGAAGRTVPMSEASTARLRLRAGAGRRAG